MSYIIYSKYINDIKPFECDMLILALFFVIAILPIIVSFIYKLYLTFIIKLYYFKTALP